MRMKKLVLIVTAATTLLPGLGNAGCLPYVNPPPDVNPNTKDGTHPVVTQQAANTWQDWVWRGNQNGALYQCPYKNSGTCNYTWSGLNSVTVGYSVSAGVSATGGVASTVTGELGISLSATYSRYTTTGSTYSPTATANKGQFMEPIWVQVRRWNSGNFQGFWVTTSKSQPDGKTYLVCQNWDPNKKAGYWSSNFAQGAPYKTFNIYN